MSESVPEEMLGVLSRYLAIQQEERRLQEEKDALQRQIAAHMGACKIEQWYPEVGGQRLAVRCRRSVRVDYDEEALRARLGDRYRLLLRPDVRKIKRNLEAVEPCLAGVLDLVGSPAPEKVKEAVAAGRVKVEEFAGAFAKTEVVSVAVSRRSESDRVSEGGLEPYAAGAGES
jgi:hypothetical protein